MRVPNFPIQDVADAYTHYVLNLGISEDLFWNADLAFVRDVAANKNAYEAWKTDAIQKQKTK